MTLMIAGLALFIVILLVPVAQDLRTKLLARFGDKGYRGLFSAVAALFSAIQRSAVKAFVPAWKYDAMAIAGGLALAYVTMRVHPALFGTGPVA